MNYWERIRERFSRPQVGHDDAGVVINGVRLAPEQISAFARLTAQPAPGPGYYWFDPATGNVGYVGSPVPYFNLYVGASPLAPRAGHSPTPAERQQLFAQAHLEDVWITSD
jgi:hypothetical protein